MLAPMTKGELAELAGYTYRRLYDIDKGLPEGEKLFVKSDGSGFDPCAFVQAWVKYNTEKDKEAEEGLDTIKAKHEAVKMAKTEIELRKMRGEVVEVEPTKRLWGNICTALTQSLLNIPSKVAPELVMVEDAESIRDRIDEEIRNTLLLATEAIPIPSGWEQEHEDMEDSDT